jgi:hypothetical protein
MLSARADRRHSLDTPEREPVAHTTVIAETYYRFAACLAVPSDGAYILNRAV